MSPTLAFLALLIELMLGMVVLVVAIGATHLQFSGLQHSPKMDLHSFYGVPQLS